MVWLRSALKSEKSLPVALHVNHRLFAWRTKCGTSTQPVFRSPHQMMVRAIAASRRRASIALGFVLYIGSIEPSSASYAGKITLQLRAYIVMSVTFPLTFPTFSSFVITHYVCEKRGRSSTNTNVLVSSGQLGCSCHPGLVC